MIGHANAHEYESKDSHRRYANQSDDNVRGISEVSRQTAPQRYSLKSGQEAFNSNATWLRKSFPHVKLKGRRWEDLATTGGDPRRQDWNGRETHPNRG